MCASRLRDSSAAFQRLPVFRTSLTTLPVSVGGGFAVFVAAGRFSVFVAAGGFAVFERTSSVRVGALGGKAVLAFVVAVRSVSGWIAGLSDNERLRFVKYATTTPASTRASSPASSATGSRLR